MQNELPGVVGYISRQIQMEAKKTEENTKEAKEEDIIKKIK